MQNLKGSKFHHFSQEDINGRMVKSSEHAGNALLVGFADRKTGGRMDEVIFDLGRHFFDRFCFIQVMDVKQVPVLLRMLPILAIRKGYRSLSEKIACEFENKNTGMGVKDIQDRFFMIPDWDGSILASVELSDAMDQIHLLVVDSERTIRYHTSSWDQASRKQVFELLEELSIGAVVPQAT